MNMDKEKRIYRRLGIDCPAQCALSKDFLEPFPVTVVDIGPEGIGFIIDENLEAGTNVYFNISFGGGRQIDLVAEVRWSKRIENSSRFRVGGKVLEISKEDLEKFVQFYCEQLIPVERGKKKILVVEDETGMAKLLTLELTQNGYDVVCACDGEDGFAKYKMERPDLIILDIMLPKLNGYEVCRKIRREEEDNDTPILMLTAKKEDVDRIVGGVVGAQKYLTKPFDAEHLLSEIKELLDSSES